MGSLLSTVDGQESILSTVEYLSSSCIILANWRPALLYSLGTMPFDLNHNTKNAAPGPHEIFPLEA